MTEYRQFQSTVWAYYKEYGRHVLPWRKTSNPYRILVSEVMLQQTQVHRVIPMYAAFMRRYPTVYKLAAAPLSEVLQAWQGLGYNRRAKMLQQAARAIVEECDGIFPDTIEGLERLPGVGPYTARAVVAFAFNKDVVFIETNIRTAIIHHFFPKKKKVSDAEIEKILIQVFSKGKSRAWYSALMDYGAYLKRSGISHNTRSRAYVKQSKFSGSLREVRGAILRALAEGARTREHLVRLFDISRQAQIGEALSALQAEGMIQKRGKAFALPR